LHYEGYFVNFIHRIRMLYTATPVLGWSALARVALTVPVLLLLWLAVWWAQLEAVPL
jgi:hypothetical protein